MLVATSRFCSIIIAFVSFIVVACSSSAALSVKLKFWKMPGKCNFNDKWLHLVEYRSWLQKVTENTHKAYCVLCMKQIDIAAMGESALKSHASGLKHKDAEKWFPVIIHSNPVKASKVYFSLCFRTVE